MPARRRPRRERARVRPWTAMFASFAYAALVGIGWAGAAARGIADDDRPLDPPAATPATTPSLPAAMIQHSRVLPYPYRQVWPTAIRYLRVDRGYDVRDRDEKAGFILFEFKVETASGQPRTAAGSLEAFQTEDSSGRPSVQVQVSTTSGPTHLPHAIVEGLANKVRAERGPPAPPPKKKDDKPKENEPKDKPGEIPIMPPAEDPN